MIVMDDMFCVLETDARRVLTVTLDWNHEQL